jgi:hypothetical protein
MEHLIMSTYFMLDQFYKTIMLHNQTQTTCANMGGVVIYKCN